MTDPPTPPPPSATAAGRDEGSEPGRWNMQNRIAIAAIALTVLLAMMAGATKYGAMVQRIDNLERAVRAEETQLKEVASDLEKSLADAATNALSRIDGAQKKLDDEIVTYEDRLKAFADQLLVTLSEQDPRTTVEPMTPPTEPQAILTAGTPIGTILAFAGSASAVPEGWMVCDGRAMQVALFPKLYASIGLLWGGEKDTFFNLPNLQGAFLRGVDPTGRVDKDRHARKVASPGSLQLPATAMPRKPFKVEPGGEHSHSFPGVRIVSGNWQSGGSSKPAGNDVARTLNTSRTGEHTHRLTGGDEETRPYNYGVHFIIRVR